MMKRSAMPVLLVCAAVCLACGSERGFEPAPVSAPVGYPEIAGVYDLTALITHFDPAWEDLTGYRYTAVLTLHEELGPPWTRGTYADFRLIGPGGDSYDVAPGFVTGSLDRGRVVIEVRNEQWMGLSLIVGKVTSEFIDGGFGCCGHISGTFRADRR
jgi:hypothetical protein